MPAHELTDGGLSIFAFAAYHSLVSGEEVTKVVLDDGKGHHADSEGVDELVRAGLLEAEGERGVLTEAGSGVLRRVMDAMRSAVSG